MHILSLLISRVEFISATICRLFPFYQWQTTATYSSGWHQVKFSWGSCWPTVCSILGPTQPPTLSGTENG